MNIILCSPPQAEQRGSGFRLIVSCLAVETRATTMGSGALRRTLPGRRKTQEPFLLRDFEGGFDRVVLPRPLRGSTKHELHGGCGS